MPGAVSREKRDTLKGVKRLLARGLVKRKLLASDRNDQGRW